MQNRNSKSGARHLLGHTSIYAIGNIIRQFVGFIMIPIYTRYLTPADYGVVGLMAFVISLIELVFGARLVQAVPRYYFDLQQEGKESALISTAMLITGVISLVTAIIIIFFRVSLSHIIFGKVEYSAIVGFFAVNLLTVALENYSLTYIRIQQRPWFFISINIAKLIVQLTLNIWLVVVKDMGVLGVALSSMISHSIFAFILLFYILRNVGWGFDTELARKMLKFCWPLWLSGFAGLYTGSANRYFIRIFASLDDIGLFELAAKFSSVVQMLIYQPFAQYWQVERFRYYERGNAESVFKEVFRFISTILILAALGISIFSGPVIRIMAAPSFFNATGAVPFLTFATVFNCLIFYLNFSFFIKDKTGWISRINYIVALYITIFYFLFIPFYGYLGAALTVLLASGIQFYIVYRVSRRFFDMGISLLPFLVMLFISLLACLISNNIFWCNNLIEDIFFKVIIYITAGILIVSPIIRDPKARLLFKEILPVFNKRQHI